MKLSSAISLPIICAALLASQLDAISESIPPGVDHVYGRVIKDQAGRVGLFTRGVFHFPPDQEAKLEGHLGEFVDCEYRRVADQMSFSGSRVGPILSIKVIAESPDKLPVTVKVTPSKAAFAVSEPVVCRIELENRSSEIQNLGGMTVASTLLCQSYEEKLRLESDMHYYELDAYKFEASTRPVSLAPGAKVLFKVTASRMAEPGEYQLVHILSVGPRGSSMQSEFARVEIFPADKWTRHDAVRHWQPVASRDQSINLASELADLGDRRAFDLFLGQLKNGRYTPRGFCYDRAYELALQKGGEAGEEIMMELIGKQRGQDKVGRMLPGIRHSPRKVDLLLGLLSNKQETMREISGWVDSPRICDVTAGWLTGYTEGKMVFPESGTLLERDDAVKAVVQSLKADPNAFRVLRADYQ
ncbi:MAG: hypothetical protein U1F81_00570 [Verrucomicrobiaceae bacterium]